MKFRHNIEPGCWVLINVWVDVTYQNDRNGESKRKDYPMLLVYHRDNGKVTSFHAHDCEVFVEYETE